MDLSDSTGLYNYDKSTSAADRNSLCADWNEVGKDLREAIDEYAADRESDRK